MKAPKESLTVHLDTDSESECPLTDTGSTEPYAPRQRVIVFKECPLSGATLGYCGTIIRLRTGSVCRHPSRPDLWKYRVYVPYFRTCMDAAARDLFPAGGLDLAELPLDEEDGGSEVHVGCDPRADLDEIHGAFRSGPVWYHFTFRKCDQPHSSFQLRLAVENAVTVAGTVQFRVPRNVLLDLEFVLRKIGRVMGGNKAVSAENAVRSPNF